MQQTHPKSARFVNEQHSQWHHSLAHCTVKSKKTRTVFPQLCWMLNQSLIDPPLHCTLVGIQTGQWRGLLPCWIVTLERSTGRSVCLSITRCMATAEGSFSATTYFSGWLTIKRKKLHQITNKLYSCYHEAFSALYVIFRTSVGYLPSTGQSKTQCLYIEYYDGYLC